MKNTIYTFTFITSFLILSFQTNAQESDSTVVDSTQTEQIFTIVETLPSFPGGMPAFYRYVGKNMNYPTQAKRMGVEGKVLLTFVVDKTGTIKDIEVVRGIGSGCDQEAIHVLKNSPKWNPGIQRGRKVNTKMMIPLIFKLSDPKKGKKKKKN